MRPASEPTRSRPDDEVELQAGKPPDCWPLAAQTSAGPPNAQPSVTRFVTLSAPRPTGRSAPHREPEGHVVGDLIKLVRGDRAVRGSNHDRLIDHLMDCRDCMTTLGLLLKAGSQATGLSDAQQLRFADLYSRLARAMADPHIAEAVALYRAFVEEWAETLRCPEGGQYQAIVAHLSHCAACDTAVRNQFSAAVAERLAEAYHTHHVAAQQAQQAPLAGAAAVPSLPERSWRDALRYRAAPALGMHVTDYHSFEIVVDGWTQGELMLVLWGRDLHHASRRRALKLLRPEYDANPAARQAFVEMALNWCHVASHGHAPSGPQLVRVPAFDDAPALLCAYAPHTLREVLSAAHQGRRDVSPAQALAWGAQTAASLVALHGHHRQGAAHPLIYGDLKPENILIGDDDDLWLSHGGLHHVWSQVGGSDGTRVHHPGRPSGGQLSEETSAATAAAASAPSTAFAPDDLTGIPRVEPLHLALDPRVGSRGAVVGTPAYMAPERWLGVDALVPASDIYALGLVLFDLFAGVSGGPFVPAPHSASVWFRAHQCGPNRSLLNDDVQALTRGPLRHLLTGTGAHLTPGEREARAYQLRNELDVLIRECLAPLPQDRPSAQLVLDKLNQFAERLELTPAPEPPAEASRALDPQHIRRVMRSYQHSHLPSAVHAHAHTHTHLRGLLTQAGQVALPEAWIAVGSLLDEQQAAYLALEAYAAAQSLAASPHVEVEPDLHAVLALHRGDSFARLGRQQEAVNEYRRSLQQRAEHIPSLVATSDALARWATAADATPDERRERLAEAHLHATHAAAIEPHNPALSAFARKIAQEHKRLTA